MNIVFHGTTAGTFANGFEALLSGQHTISQLSFDLTKPGEREAFEGADVIIGNYLGASQPAPKALKLFHAPAAGTDQIEPARLPKGAKLCNCFGHEQPIAEYVMAALLMRHVPLQRADERLRQGHWDYWGGLSGALHSELGDNAICLVGYGHIGKAIAARAKAFGMRVIVVNRSKIAPDTIVDESFTLEDLTTAIRRADAIVVSLPLAENTRGIFGAAALAAMKPDAVIINVGRGPVVDEQALFDALSARRIGGAIIDTWYTYPTAAAPIAQPSKLPFNTLPNVVMTPHMSGWTNGTIRRRQETMADNIARLMRGEPLVNVVA